MKAHIFREYDIRGLVDKDLTVEVVELLGHELHLYLNSGKNNLVGTVDPRFGVHSGNQIGLVFDMGTVHLFDKATEKAIREGQYSVEQ